MPLAEEGFSPFLLLFSANGATGKSGGNCYHEDGVRSLRSFHPARARAGFALAVAAGAAFHLLALACGLSSSGLASNHEGEPTDASADTVGPSHPPDADGAPGPIGAMDGADPGALDSATDAAAASSDASDGSHPCLPTDAGMNGALDLSKFILAGNASFSESGDGRITLTDSLIDQAGAAWSPSLWPGPVGYDLTFSIRVGPNDTAGDGITFSVLASTGSPPGVGENGDGLGLRNIAAAGGGVASGYAVDVDMYQDFGDTTDLGPTTLKLLTMPAFKVVAALAVPSALNDGNVYPVNVTWRPPSTLTATLHGPGAPVTVTSSDPGLAVTSAAYIGVTGATGGIADSHNQVAEIAVTNTCAP
jgi:hypothetical protein